MCNSPDIRLVNVWLDLGELTKAINLAHQTQRKLSPWLFQEALISVQYRLQHLTYDVDDKPEALRLAMLAFSTTMFFKAEAVPLNYVYLAHKLRAVLSLIGEDASTDWSRLCLWLIFVGRVSVLDSAEDLLLLQRQFLKINLALRLTRWSEARQILKGFMWVDFIHNGAGEDFFYGALKHK